MRNQNFLAVILFSIILMPLQVRSEGTNTDNVLTHSLGAKPQGMGEAYASIPADEGRIAALQYNPASIAFLREKEAAVTYKGGIFGDSSGILSFGSPFSSFGLPSRLGSAAGTFLYYSLGDAEYIDGGGNLRKVNAQKDFGFILTYGNKLFSENLSLGVNGKILHSKLIEQFSATAFALDAGAMYQWNNFSIGGGLQNFGSRLKYNRTSEFIPVGLRWGISHRMKWFSRNQSITSLDVIKRRDESWKANVGLEYLYDDSKFPIALRGGYRMGEDTGKINFGVGLNFSKLALDYSMQVMAGTENSHFITLGFLFGGSQSQAPTPAAVAPPVKASAPSLSPTPSKKPAAPKKTPSKPR